MNDKMPWLPLFASDFIVGTAGMSAAAVGCYVLLLCHQWDRGSLPGDLKALDRLVPGTRRAWPELASKFAKRDDGTFVNERIESERSKSRELSEARSRAGSNGAANRWQTDGKGIGKRDGKRMAKPLANAMANSWPSQSQSHSHPSPPSGVRGDGGGEIASQGPEPEAAADAAVAVAEPDPPSFAIGMSQALRRFGPVEGRRKFAEAVEGRRGVARRQLASIGLVGEQLDCAVASVLGLPWDSFSDELNSLVTEARTKESPAGWIAWRLGARRTG